MPTSKMVTSLDLESDLLANCIDFSTILAGVLTFLGSSARAAAQSNHRSTPLEG